MLNKKWLHFFLLIIQSEYLKVRSHDPEEAIRHDVIVTIINAGKKDLNLVNDQLLGFVRERTLDKRVRQICTLMWVVIVAVGCIYFTFKSKLFLSSGLKVLRCGAGVLAYDYFRKRLLIN